MSYKGSGIDHLSIKESPSIEAFEPSIIRTKLVFDHVKTFLPTLAPDLPLHWSVFCFSCVYYILLSHKPAWGYRCKLAFS